MEATRVCVEGLDCSTLRDCRIVQGFTQKELAALVGVSVETIDNWDHGRNKVQMRFRRRLALQLGLTMAQLNRLLDLHP